MLNASRTQTADLARGYGREVSWKALGTLTPGPLGETDPILMPVGRSPLPSRPGPLSLALLFCRDRVAGQGVRRLPSWDLLPQRDSRGVPALDPVGGPRCSQH